MSDSEPARVLAVDDDQSLVETYATWLADRYTVETATTGAAALDALGPDIDVILLDRRMPDLTGDRVLEIIREQDSDTRVALVTGVRPTADIFELGFDEYLVKPITREELHDVVARLIDRSIYGRTLQEYYALADERATLALTDDSNTVDTPTRQDLERRISALDDHLERTTASFGPADFQAAFRDLDSDQD